MIQIATRANMQDDDFDDITNVVSGRQLPGFQPFEDGDEGVQRSEKYENNDRNFSAAFHSLERFAPYQNQYTLEQTLIVDLSCDGAYSTASTEQLRKRDSLGNESMAQGTLKSILEYR